MEIGKFSKCKEKIDGEDCYILDEKIYNNVNLLKKLDGVVDSEIFIKYVAHDVSFVKEHKGFCIALYKIRSKISNWFPCILYFYEGAWRRIQLEFTECEFCGWKGQIANPTIPDLYIAIPERVEALNRALNLPVVSCPKCENKLNRHAIWVEKI